MRNIFNATLQIYKLYVSFFFFLIYFRTNPKPAETHKKALTDFIELRLILSNVELHPV